MGLLKDQLSSDEKKELLEVIDHYRQEYIPHCAYHTIQHYVRNMIALPKQQVYLIPILELQLRTMSRNCIWDESKFNSN